MIIRKNFSNQIFDFNINFSKIRNNLNFDDIILHSNLFDDITIVEKNSIEFSNRKFQNRVSISNSNKFTRNFRSSQKASQNER